MINYIYSKADFPVYLNYSTGNYEVYTSTSINGRKLFECKTQAEASKFCLEKYYEIYNNN